MSKNKTFDTGQEWLEHYAVPVPECGCWLFERGAGSAGYGALYSKFYQCNRGAHIISYEMFYGPVPHGLVVFHRCDVRLCVNPKHLFVGTYRDNIQDSLRKGTKFKKEQTHCFRGHELPGRYCDICARDRQRWYREHPGQRIGRIKAQRYAWHQDLGYGSTIKIFSLTQQRTHQ